MQTKPLYKLWFSYPEWFSILVEGQFGVESQFFGVGEGRCEGIFNGRLVLANHPRRTGEGGMCPNLQGVVHTDDGAVIYLDIQGRATPASPPRRPFLCAIFHLTADERYKRLNSSVCMAVGEARLVEGENAVPRSGKIQMAGPTELVMEVCEVVWEPLSV